MTALLFLLGVGCSSPEQETSGTTFCSEAQWFKSPKLKVLCTTAQVGGLVATVGGPDIATLVLIQGDLDPHSYQLVKGDDEKLDRADLVFASGLGLEHGPSLQQFLMSQNKVQRLGDLVREQNAGSLIRVDGQLDPHIWLDISIWKETVPFISDSLSKALPEHAQDFQKRAHELQVRLSTLDQDLLRAFHAIPEAKRYLVTSHDAFQYFTRRYLAATHERESGAWRERLCAPEGLAPEGQLGLVDIQRVLSFCETHDVRVLFPESNVNISPLKKVVESGRQRGYPLRLASEPVYGDTMGEDGMCSLEHAYETMMLHNQRTMTREWMELP
jgi:manganese/zinc/iron transport system substrate-binding protein